MRIDFRDWLTGVTGAVLLTIGLIAWPAAAAAGQADAGAGQEPRVEQAAAPPIAWSEPRPSALSLRLFGGFNRVEAGDVNDALDGYYELLELYEAHGFGTTGGGYNPLRDGYHGGADLVLQITPGIGIGIGAGYMRFQERSEMTLSHESEDISTSNTTTLSAIPIRIGVFLSLPLARGFDLTVGAGAVAFANLRLDDKRLLEIASGDREEARLSARGVNRFDRLGYHGSVGFEIRISPTAGLFIEALGRIARLKNFGTAAWSGQSGSGETESIEGRLYLRTYRDGATEYSTYVVAETPPVPPYPNVTYKEPVIDLGGVSLQAGFRFRL